MTTTEQFRENLDKPVLEPKESKKIELEEFIQKYHKKRDPGELFSGIGIYGWGNIEDLIMAAFSRGVGSNVMLEGEAGAGKTSGARIIGSAFFGPENVRIVKYPGGGSIQPGYLRRPGSKSRKACHF